MLSTTWDMIFNNSGIITLRCKYDYVDGIICDTLHVLNIPAKWFLRNRGKWGYVVGWMELGGLSGWSQWAGFVGKREVVGCSGLSGDNSWIELGVGLGKVVMRHIYTYIYIP